MWIPPVCTQTSLVAGPSRRCIQTREGAGISDRIIRIREATMMSTLRLTVFAELKLKHPFNVVVPKSIHKE